MKWFLIIALISGSWSHGMVVGPFNSKQECLRVERQVQYHYKTPWVTQNSGVPYDTDCVSGAR